MMPFLVYKSVTTPDPAELEQGQISYQGHIRIWDKDSNVPLNIYLLYHYDSQRLNGNTDTYNLIGYPLAVILEELRTLLATFGVNLNFLINNFHIDLKLNSNIHSLL